MYNSKYPSVSLNLYRITHDNPAKTKGGTVPTTETGWSRGHGRYIESSQSDSDIKCKSPVDWLLSHIPRGPLSTFLLKCSWQYSASCCFGHPVTPELVGNLYQRLASRITSSIHCFNNRENSASSNCNSHQSFNIFHQSMKICCEKDGPMSFGAEFVM